MYKSSRCASAELVVLHNTNASIEGLIQNIPGIPGNLTWSNGCQGYYKEDGLVAKEHWVMSVDSRFDQWYAAVKHKLAKESFYVLSDIFFAISTQADSFGGNSEISAHTLNTFISQGMNHKPLCFVFSHKKNASYIAICVKRM